jgi:hypothetical protein
MFVVLEQGSGPVIVGAITTYVLRNDKALGEALAITVGGGMILATFFLVWALVEVRKALDRVALGAGDLPAF